MRIGEAEEHLAELPASEEIGQELHRVGSRTCNVPVKLFTGLPGLRPHCMDFVMHEFGNRRAQFHAW